MYQINYRFNNIIFTLKSDDISTFNEQIKHISQFYINCKCTSDNKINIEYIENLELYTRLVELLKNLEYKSYQTFVNQIHYEYNIDYLKYYMIDSKEYICIKYEDDNYQIISDGRQTAKKWPFRIIREILVRKNEENYGLFMHGTGFTLENNGILVLGNSGSGKTTLTTKLFEANSNMGFLSNDRIFMYMNEHPVIEYFPIPVVYAMGTVKESSKLKSYFEQTRILEERTGKKFETAKNNDKVDIPLTDIEQIFSNVFLVNESKLDCIVFPSLSMESKEEIVELSPKEKEIILNQTCFTIFDWESMRLEWIYKRKIKNDEIIARKIETISNIINSISVVKLNYNFETKGEKIKELIKKI